MCIKKLLKKRFAKILAIVMILTLSIGTISWAAQIYDLSVPPGENSNTYYTSTEFDGVFWEIFRPAGSTGTGVFDPFLRVQSNGSEHGYNTDVKKPEFDTKAGVWTHGITLSQIPLAYGGPNDMYYGREFLIDINETANDPTIVVKDYVFWLTSNPAIDGYAPTGSGPAKKWSSTNYEPVWVGEIDWDFVNNTPLDRELIMDYSVAAGSGKGDYRVLIPDSYFMDAIARYNTRGGIQLTPQTAWLVLYVYHDNTSDGFEEWGVLSQTTASKSGMKFEDLNANGIKDTGEPGLEGWTIYVDYDNDGVLDADEPYGVTDTNGLYQISGINAGTWRVKEVQQAGWTQSYPASGYHEETFVGGMNYPDNDFGNWRPATKSGMKFEDLNANGVMNPGEPGLAGWTIYVDYDNDGVLDADEPYGVTDTNGLYQISGINAGTWRVKEVQQAGYTQSYPASGYHEETFTSGASFTDNNFGNWRPATKSGMKFEDLDADGVKDVGEPGLGGWRIYVDLNDNGLYDVGEPTDVTAADGTYQITGIKPGSYKVREVLQAGWTNSYPALGYYSETFTSGANEINNDFGNWRLATKSGMKFEDLDADGIKDVGEPGLSGWTIYVDYNDNGVLDVGEPSAVTTAGGLYTINGINLGTFKVREVAQAGWTQSYPASGYHEETFTSGASFTDNNFGNWRPATKSGYKFYDKNGNGIWDADDYVLEGWTIFIDLNNNGVLDGGEPSTVTNANGYYEFTGLTPGEYYFREVLKPDWYNSAPALGYYHETLVSGQHSQNNNFGNTYYHDETAWRYGNIENWDYSGSSNWGWTDGPFTLPEGIDQFTSNIKPLYAAAGQNDITKGVHVGSVEVVITKIAANKYTVQVKYTMLAGYSLKETHVWIGETPLPTLKKGSYTDAPGQMKYVDGQIITLNNPSQIYVAAHSVVRIYGE
jgi:hypothetical protein